MRGRAASIIGRRQLPWLRKQGYVARLAGCFLSVVLATTFVKIFARSGAEGDLIWVANGLLIAYLLVIPRRRWPAYLVTGFLALVLGSALTHETWRMNLLLNMLDIIEVLIAASLMRRGREPLPRFTEPAYLLRFIGFAVLAAPIATASAFAWITAYWMHFAPLHEFLRWAGADSLGIAVITPICVAIFQSDFKDRSRWQQNWIYVLLTTAVAIGAFSQSSVPLIFLVYPLLVIITLRADLGWAALTLLLVAVVGSWYTQSGQGLFVATAHVSSLRPILLLQMYIAVGMFMLYSVSVVMERQKAAERKLREIVSLHTLITESSRDLIILADLNGHRSYVSAGAESMGGWTPEELMEQDGLFLVHPEDLARAQAALRDLRSGAGEARLELRLRKRSGEYVWGESSLRVTRDPATGVPCGILNTVRDISERKRAEESREFHNSLIRAIHDVSLDGILVVNEIGNVVSHNKKFSDIWQIPMADICVDQDEKTSDALDQWLLSKTVNLVKGPEDFEKRVRELNADPDANDQCQVELKDGRTLERYSTSLRGEGGKYLGRVWFFSDITERKQAEHKLQEAYRTVEALALTDGLTGVANRRRFDQYLAAEWRRSMRSRQPLSLLMLDADKFKMYNDTYGHLRGDSCLRQISEACQDVVSRPGDLVARFGGEEFAVILPNTESAGAVQVAQEICAALRGRQLPHSGNPSGIVTVSIGCATLVPLFGRHAPDLIARADKALYEAKGKGRDKVCFANTAEKRGEDAPPESAAGKTV